MRRTELPRAWRVAVGASGALVLLFVLLTLAAQSAPPFARAALDPAQVAWGALGVALAVGMFRAGGRDRKAALAGVGIGILFAVVASSPLALFIGVGVGVPAALVAARPHPVATALVAVGIAGTLFAMLTLTRVGPTPAIEQDGQARALAFAAVGALLALGLLGYALVTRSQPTRRLPRRARMAVVATGVALLMISWLVGGHVFWLPLWPVPLALLVLPPLWSWRAWPAGALLVAAIAAVGAVPAATCTWDAWSDAPPSPFGSPEPVPQRVPIGAVGANGPLWQQSGGGFSGLRVTCPLPALALGLAWDVALVAAAAAFARREPRERAQQVGTAEPAGR